MASEREHHIPAWDGTSRTWRRYTREVCWYVRATPVEKRRYCATKLLTRLTGPARLLAMSWTSHDFDHVHGTRDLLRMLAESPLVRQNLPNAAAICQQYFSFKRGHQEAMNSFLVREALGFSEFVEAILMLMEDRMGVRQHEKNFGLLKKTPKNGGGPMAIGAKMNLEKKKKLLRRDTLLLTHNAELPMLVMAQVPAL